MSGTAELFGRVPGQSRAKRAVRPPEVAERPVEVEAPLDRGHGVRGVAEPGGVAVALRQRFGDGAALGARPRVIERHWREHLPLALYALRQPRGPVRDNGADEGAPGAAAWIEGALPRDQIGQEILTELVALVAGQPELRN